MKTTSSNQEQFLNNIAKQLGRSRSSGVLSPTWDHFPWDHLYTNVDQNTLITEFLKNLGEIGGYGIRLDSQNVAEEVERIRDKYHATRIIAWEDERLSELKIKDVLAGKANYKSWITTNDFNGLTEYAKDSHLGITYADLGLAETGTIMLYNEGGKGRSVSLLPEIHIAILPASKIRPRLTQAMKKIKETFEEDGKLPSLINFISGPSRTSDIEMVLTIGVHGPKELYVLVLNDK